MPPLVLISNDDGIDSDYITELAGELERKGLEIMVVAPEKPRSAMSQSITLHKPLRVYERAPGRYAVSGTPTDSVYIALNKLVSRTPDLVVSGINDGYNLGTDVFYSGTVGAAIEGALRGVPALAISAEPGRRVMHEKIDIAVAVVMSALEGPHAAGQVVNVNIPDGCRGYRWTRLGQRFYGDDVQERDDPRGRAYFWIGGGEVQMGRGEGTDCAAVLSGHASLTPLRLDLTDHARLEDGDRLWPVKGLSKEAAE